MRAFREGKVAALLESRGDLVRTLVTLDDGTETVAVGWRSMLGPVEEGDRVVVNVAGIDLGLGTGGEGFLLWNLDGTAPEGPAPGHIVKLRYTPWQRPVLAVEAPESPHHERLARATGIEGMPVVAAGLHSQVAAIAAGVKARRPKTRVGYLMTDAGALPMEWSELVARLREAGLVDVTCTSGHAFGGDLESVNVFSGIVALREVGLADVVVVATGPGVVGTGTALGFSALEQGQVLDATTGLGGSAIACLRITFTDERDRQRGVSHHSLTSLDIAAREPCTIAVPALVPDKLEVVRRQLAEMAPRRHRIEEADGAPGLRLLVDSGIRPTSMGRRFEEIPELFLAGAAAGSIAAARVGTSSTTAAPD